MSDPVTRGEPSMAVPWQRRTQISKTGASILRGAGQALAYEKGAREGDVASLDPGAVYPPSRRQARAGSRDARAGSLAPRSTS